MGYASVTEFQGRNPNNLRGVSITIRIIRSKGNLHSVFYYYIREKKAIASINQRERAIIVLVTKLNKRFQEV